MNGPASAARDGGIAGSDRVLAFSLVQINLQLGLTPGLRGAAASPRRGERARRASEGARTGREALSDLVPFPLGRGRPVDFSTP